MVKYRRPRYNKAFKAKAMALAEEIGCIRAGEILGVDHGSLRMMLHLKKNGTHMKRDFSPEERELFQKNKEIEKLKKENEELKKANLILREVASVFSKDHPHTSLEWSENFLKKRS